MATYRKRMLASCIWEDEKFCQLSRLEKFLFIGLITYADDDGRLRGDPRYLKNKVFPFDRIGISKVKKMTDRLHEMKLIVLYPTQKCSVISLPGWKKYQKITKGYQPSEFEPPFSGAQEKEDIQMWPQDKVIQSNESKDEVSTKPSKAELMKAGIQKISIQKE